jgi:sodium-dependent phosphate cotransporter
MNQRISKRGVLFKIFKLLFLLYFFLVSIKLMGATFKQYKDVAESLIETANNPFFGLLIGILATSIVQSSSTTTSMVVGLVGSGLIDFQIAIPMIMGANIGTSVTNTIVSMGNISREDEFKRAFSASTVHDFFNIMAVLIFFPLEYFTGFLSISASYMADIFQQFGGGKSTNYLKIILKPAVNLIKEIFAGNALLMLGTSLALLFITLKYLSSTLKKVFIGRFQNLFDRIVFKNAAMSFVLGIILTVLVQSSSVTTSLVVPLAGAGILNIHQIVPYTLGANIGTTVTAILASLATGQIAAVTVAFAHLLFNIFGTTFIYPMRKIPIYLSELLSRMAIKNKAIPILYILIVFFLIPFSLIYLTK